MTGFTIRTTRKNGRPDQYFVSNNEFRNGKRIIPGNTDRPRH